VTAKTDQTRKLMSNQKQLRKGRISRTHLLIRQLWSALETVEGRRLTTDELSGHLNLSDSALSEWILGKTDLNQIEAFVRLCERVGSPTCFDLLRQHLRVFPTLRSPELAHDPASVDLLRSLLQKPSGLTLIVGGETHRTFLFNAMAHSYLAANTECHSLPGWDVHSPSWFVPVPGLLYNVQCEPFRLMLDPLRHTLVLSNGFWQRYQEHRNYLIECARSHHVIVADGLSPQTVSEHLSKTRIPVNIIQVTGDTTHLNLVVTTMG
jgi:hypothetical protein